MVIHENAGKDIEVLPGHLIRHCMMPSDEDYKTQLISALQNYVFLLKCAKSVGWCLFQRFWGLRLLKSESRSLA